MNLPNKLTVLRIVLVVPLIILFCILMWYSKCVENIEWNKITYKNNSQYFLYGIGFIFMLSMITDFIDGHLARKNKMVTKFGKLFDPLADKIIVNTTLLFLTIMNISYLLVFLLFVLRDLVVDGARNLAATNNLKIEACIYGKIKTLIQSFAIPLILFISPLIDMTTWWEMLLINLPLLISLIFSLVSGFIYFKQIVPIIKKDK